jgi:uncharacterized membrane protein YoaK (UPF0700 family)
MAAGSTLIHNPYMKIESTFAATGAKLSFVLIVAVVCGFQEFYPDLFVFIVVAFLGVVQSQSCTGVSVLEIP